MSSDIAVDNAAVLSGLSPANWYRNGSTAIQTVNPGAYLKINFTGTSIGIGVDVSAMSAASYAAGIYPVIKWSIDGGAPSTQQLTASDTVLTLASGLADTTHSFRLDLIGVDQSGDSNRWNPPKMSLVVTKLVVDTSKTVTAATLNGGACVMGFFDSIGEGAVTLRLNTSSITQAQVQDATKSYAVILANMLAREYAIVGFGGQGWESGISSVPGLPDSYNLLFSGQSRSFSPAPGVVLVNMGTNGSVESAEVTSFLTALRTSVGATAYIFFMIPFNQRHAAAIGTGFDDYHTGAPSDTRTIKLDLGSTGDSIVTANSYDGTHPNAAGHALLANALWPLMTPYLGVMNPRPGGGAFAGISI